MIDCPDPAEPVWFASLSTEQRQELHAPSGAPLLQRPDVLVVGGGIVGLALAYFLAELGASVQLIEAQSLASGASGTNFGGIWPNDQGRAHPPPFQALAFLSRDLWGRLSVRPGFDFDWRVNGLLNVNPERFAPSAREFAAKAQEQGCSLTAVDAEQIALLEPHLKRGLLSGLHYPSEASLHPVKAALSFARAARQRGARLSVGVRAGELKLAGSRVVAVETSAGRVEPGKVVCATGWNGDWMRGVLPGKIPLRPVSGQMLATDPLPPLLKSSILGAVLVVQLRSGEIVTGGSTLESDSLVPDPELSRRFAAAARDLVPELAGVPFTRVWCGIRPATPDGLPILDRSEAADNLWLACGHFRNGMLLAPASGKLLSEWMLQGAPSQDLSGFGAGRFSRQAQ